MLSFYTKSEALNCPVVDERWSSALRAGYDEIAEYLRDQILEKQRAKTALVVFDGYLGVGWDSFIPRIVRRLSELGVECLHSVDVSSCIKSQAAVERMVEPCFSNDQEWGRVYDGELEDFFQIERLVALRKELLARLSSDNDGRSGMILAYGVGAALPFISEPRSFIAYVDLTKEELYRRFDSGEAFLLGSRNTKVSEKYVRRRLSYVDFRVLQQHKRRVLDRMQWYILGNSKTNPILAPSEAYRGILDSLARYPFRPKPFYFPRVWGGTFMIKERNLALKRCSFCMEVTPRKQSIRILVGDIVLDIQFQNFLWNNSREIMGPAAVKTYGEYFPLTLNYDDTYGGGNLAIQCHPGRRYMREYFNEFHGHDETYYVVKAWEGSKTYHGIRDGCNLAELKALAERAQREQIPFDYESYINSWDYPGTEHELYLHPSGTVHASGENQLILEIDFDGSYEGQEYTFHLYDYLRPDLDGSLRGIHLEHFFHELRAERTRSWIIGKLKQDPRLIRTDDHGGREYLIGDYHEMHYKIHRLEFETVMQDDTAGRFHVLSLVQGEGIMARSRVYPERAYQIKYTESVIVPAALGSYEIINTGASPCKVVKSMLR